MTDEQQEGEGPVFGDEDAGPTEQDTETAAHGELADDQEDDEGLEEEELDPEEEAD